MGNNIVADFYDNADDALRRLQWIIDHCDSVLTDDEMYIVAEAHLNVQEMRTLFREMIERDYKQIQANIGGVLSALVNKGG